MASVTQTPRDGEQTARCFDALIIGAGFPASTSCSPCATGWGCRPGSWKQVRGSEGPGTGTGTPVHAATPRATPIALRLAKSCLRSGSERALSRPPGDRRYLNHVADRFDLRRDIAFNARVVAAHYDEATNRWRVTTANGGRLPGKVSHHRRWLSVHGERTQHTGARRALPVAGCTPGSGRTRASISAANASV